MGYQNIAHKRESCAELVTGNAPLIQANCVRIVHMFYNAVASSE